MNNSVSIKKNIIMNALLTMSGFLFPLISFPYISRVLGPEGYGKVALATSWISYFNMVAQLGIPTYGIRACAKVRDDKKELSKTVHELLLINLCMSIVSYLCLGALLLFNAKLRQERFLYLIVSLLILFNAIGMEWLYRGLEKYSYITKRSLAFKLIALVLMFLLVRSRDDYIWYGFVSIFAASASGILNFINARKYIMMHPLKEYQLKRHIKGILIFFAMSCATTVYTNLDTVMLGFLKTDVDVGYYSTAVKIKSILVSVVTSLGAVLLPRVSYYIGHGNTDEFNKITSKALRFVMVFSIPLTVYFILFAKPGIFFISGIAFENSVIPMKIIMPTLIFIGMTNILGIQILVPLGREKVVLYSEISGAVVDFILNLVFIPRFASAGAAAGTLIAEITVFLVQFFALRDLVISIFKKIEFNQIAIAVALGTAASIWCLRFETFSVAFQLKQFFILAGSALIFWGLYLIVLILYRNVIAMELLITFTDFIRKQIKTGK